MFVYYQLNVETMKKVFFMGCVHIVLHIRVFMSQQAVI